MNSVKPPSLFFSFNRRKTKTRRWNDFLRVTQLVSVKTGNKIGYLIPSPVHCSTAADIIVDSMDDGNPGKNTF